MSKTDNKKQAKIISKSIKKDHKNILQIFLKIREFKKEIMLTIELKICQMQIETEKRNVREVITIKEKI